MVLDWTELFEQAHCLCLVDWFEIPLAGTLVRIVWHTHVERPSPYAQVLVFLLRTAAVVELVEVFRTIACACGCTDVDDVASVLVACIVEYDVLVRLLGHLDRCSELREASLHADVVHVDAVAGLRQLPDEVSLVVLKRAPACIVVQTAEHTLGGIFCSGDWHVVLILFASIDGVLVLQVGYDSVVAVGG